VSGAAQANVALVFHLLGAFVLMAGAVVTGVAFEAARRRRGAAEIALLLGLTRVGVVLVVVGSAVVLPFGLWLVHIDHITYGASWVDAALGLLAVLAAIGLAAGQLSERARRLALQLGDDDEATSELRALLDDRAARALSYCAGALLIAIVVLMVSRPGGSG
jgi:uncharacterized membrane protein